MSEASLECIVGQEALKPSLFRIPEYSGCMALSFVHSRSLFGVDPDIGDLFSCLFL